MGSLLRTHHLPQLFQSHLEKTPRSQRKLWYRCTCRKDMGHWATLFLPLKSQQQSRNGHKNVREDSALLKHFAVGAVHTRMGVLIRVNLPVTKCDLKGYVRNMIQCNKQIGCYAPLQPPDQPKSKSWTKHTFSRMWGQLHQNLCPQVQHMLPDPE
jgi:hypothetical protein